MRESVLILLFATLTLAACDSDARGLAEAIEQYCAVAVECDDSRYCNLVLECDEAGDCTLALECGGQSAREACELEHEQRIEEQEKDDCVPLWTSFLWCQSTLSCLDFDTSVGDDICADEVSEDFGEELLDHCGLPW